MTALQPCVFPAVRRQRAALFALVMLAASLSSAHAQTEPQPVTIVHFVDYGSAASHETDRLISRIQADYGKQVRIVVRNFPANSQAQFAHLAALAADRDGRFDQVHASLMRISGGYTLASVMELAKQAGLDAPAFKAAVESASVRNRLEQDVAEAQALGIPASPAIILKGRVFSATIDDAAIRRALDMALGKTLLDKPASLNLTSAPRLGPAGVPEITVFSDFQCPYCATLVPVLKQLADSGEAAIRFKHFPLSFHTKAPLAHRAAIAAGEQGKFWEMHDRIFAAQNRLDRDTFLGYAKDLGLDVARFQADISREGLPDVLKDDLAEGERLPVQGTPTLLINGRQYLGANSPDALRAALRSVGGKSAAPVIVSELSLYGSPDASATVEWFFDAQSELTPAAALRVKAFIESRPANVRVIARHLPLPFHPESPLVHEALSLAAAEGRFWDFLQVLHRAPGAADSEKLKAIASRVGLNMVAFSQELDRRSRKAEVERDLGLARSRNIRGVPAFAVNGASVEALPEPQQLAQLTAGKVGGN